MMRGVFRASRLFSEKDFTNEDNCAKIKMRRKLNTTRPSYLHRRSVRFYLGKNVRSLFVYFSYAFLLGCVEKSLRRGMELRFSVRGLVPRTFYFFRRESNK